MPVPPVDTAAAQLNVPEPVALAVTGALMIGTPFSVPVHVPFPPKLYDMAVGVPVSPPGEKDAVPAIVHCPETVAALAEVTGTSTSAPIVNASMARILRILPPLLYGAAHHRSPSRPP